MRFSKKDKIYPGKRCFPVFFMLHFTCVIIMQHCRQRTLSTEHRIDCSYPKKKGMKDLMDILMEKAELEQLAPTSEEVFTNAELADRLGKVQEGLLQMLLAAGFAENVAPRDMTAFLGILADKYGLKEDPDFLSLCSGTKQLGFQIASLKRGAAGERRTRDGLRNLEFIPGVKILYNVTLDNGSERTEYDAIVLTPFGIFVIETKNFHGNARITEKGVLIRNDDRCAEYNLGENLNRKEFLLRSCLGNLSSVPYHAMLLYADEKSDVQDDYHQIPVTFCNTVASAIRQFDTGDELISSKDLAQIERLIVEHQVDARYPCRIDCHKIVSDLFSVLEKIETVKVKRRSSHEQESFREKKTEYTRRHPKPYPWWKKAGLTLLGIGAGVGGTLLVQSFFGSDNSK